MNKTAIEWCDLTWNPVTGCLHGCSYCYARRIARRFCTNEHGTGDGLLAPCDGNCRACSEMDGLEFVCSKIRIALPGESPFPYGFLPTLHKDRLTEPARKKTGARIFVCSMADLFGEWVPDKWIKSVFEACEAAPQHQYLFLTKNGQRYEQLGLLPDRENFWYGTTRTGTNRELESGASDHRNIFLSVEPLLAPLQKETIEALELWSWVIIGAETGNRKGKVTPAKEWIDEIVQKCKESGTPVFMKDSLIPIVGEENMLRELPEGLRAYEAGHGKNKEAHDGKK